LAKLFFKTFISLKHLSDYRTVGPSDYRTVGLSNCRIIATAPSFIRDSSFCYCLSTAKDAEKAFLNLNSLINNAASTITPKPKIRKNKPILQVMSEEILGTVYSQLMYNLFP
jgi:hypothetical protein